MKAERTPVEIMEEALRWYADPENYEEWVPGAAYTEVIPDAVWPNNTEREWEPDGGDRAREALAAGCAEGWLPVELECCARCKATDAYDCNCAENDPQARRVTVLYAPVGALEAGHA